MAFVFLKKNLMALFCGRFSVTSKCPYRRLFIIASWLWVQIYALCHNALRCALNLKPKLSYAKALQGLSKGATYFNEVATNKARIRSKKGKICFI